MTSTASAPKAGSPIAGTWKVTIHGPTGPQETVLELNVDNGEITGVQSAMGQVEDILEPSFDEASGELSWVNKIAKPLPLKLKFVGVLEDGEISGKVNASIMGAFPFTAVRA